MSFPLPGVAQRLADQTGAPLQEAERREWFFRRWFVVVASCDVMIGMSSAQVDEYWHLLLDESELYRAYSLAVCGRVIRHIEGAGGPKLEARSWVAYEEVWGTPPAADLWPRPPERYLRKIRASSRTSKRGGNHSVGNSSGGCGMVFTTFSEGHHSHDAGQHGDAGSGHDGGGHGCGGSGCSDGGSSCGGGCGGG
jgi:hypothetical protein